MPCQMRPKGGKVWFTNIRLSEHVKSLDVVIIKDSSDRTKSRDFACEQSGTHVSSLQYTACHATTFTKWHIIVAGKAY